MPQLNTGQRKAKILPPVRPNAGLEARYRRALWRLIDDMHASLRWWIIAQYRATPPRMAEDAVEGAGEAARARWQQAMSAARMTPAQRMQKRMRELIKQWQKNIAVAGPQMGAYFAQAIGKRTDAQLKAILKKSGFAVEFQMTPKQRDVLAATMNQQVGLIKSIGEEHLGQVEQAVMRSVQAGGDLKTLTDELENRYNLTRKRAALIARHQNNMATATLQRVRQQELGIKQAVWLHSLAGKAPRRTHLANNGKVYDTAKGWYDPDPKVKRHIFPGELINCLPGSVEVQFADRVTKGYRRRYRGYLAEIVTDQGETLRATLNHPVLTPIGWRPIGALHEGDYVLHVSRECVGLMENHIDRGVPTIAQIFGSVAQSRASRRILKVGLGGDFHGDILSDSDIDIVCAARPLEFGWQSCCVQGGHDLTFADTDPAHFGDRLGGGLGAADLLTPARMIGRLDQRFPAGFAFSLHSDAAGVAATPDLAAGGENASCDGIAGDAVFPFECEQAFAGFVFRPEPVRVVRVDRTSFDGHVYNLETECGWYIAGNVLLHNCRCVSKSIVPGFESTQSPLAARRKAPPGVKLS